MKLPTSTQIAETATREKVYKVLRVGTRGKGLYSALAGKFGSAECKDAQRLEYKLGMVTEDVMDGEGLFIYLDKDYAIAEATKMAEKVDGRKLVIYTAKPIGDVTIPAGKSKTAVCDSLLLLGDKVWESKKAENWKDITNTITTHFGSPIVFADSRWTYIVMKNGKFAVAIGLPKTIKVEIAHDGNSFKVFKNIA
jgi:hypothetical protein